MWVEGIKGACSSIQTSLLWLATVSHLLPESVSLILHHLTYNPQGQVESGDEYSREQAAFRFNEVNGEGSIFRGEMSNV